MEGEGGRFRRNHCVPMPVVDSIDELNALLAAADDADDHRRIANRSNSVGQDWEVEKLSLHPVAEEPFDTTLTLTPRVDRYAQVMVRCNQYSVPARFIGHRLRVKLSASAVTVYDRNTVVAQHQRAVGKGAKVLDLDHYLEILARKPGALPGATALAQARAAKVFTAEHDAWWALPARPTATPAGTRALVEVLLLHRHLDRADVVAGISAALSVGSTNVDVVALEARKAAERNAGAGVNHRRRCRRLGCPSRGTIGGRRRAPNAVGGPVRHLAQSGNLMTRGRNVTDQAATAAIEQGCRMLRLPTIRDRFGEIAAAAEREQLSYLGFLSELVIAECDDRSRRRAERRVRDAGFPRPKRLEEFSFDANPAINPAVIGTLSSCAWVKAGDPLCLIGDSGTGKSHLLIALGTLAAEAGYRVRYTLASKLVNELVEAADDQQLTKLITRYGRVDLILIDELGYLQLDRRGAELLFQVLTEREERSAVAIASNEPFSSWTKTFTDPRLCAAIVDRLTFAGQIIETGTTSYRLAHARKRRNTPEQ